MKTGVFFNKIFKGKDGPIIGDKFQNFPEVMEDVLKFENVILYESKPVDEDLLHKVHTRDLIILPKKLQNAPAFRRGMNATKELQFFQLSIRL